MAGERKRTPRSRKQTSTGGSRRRDWPALLLLAFVLASFLLPQRAWLESAWYQLTARFHPQPTGASPWLLVEIDQASYQRLGNWPWDQHQFSLITAQLLDMNPAGLVLLQQPPSHWHRDSLRLLDELEKHTPAALLHKLKRQLDSPDTLYRHPGLHYASMPGPGPLDWPTGLPVQTVETAEPWRRALQWGLYLLTGPTYGLEQAGQFHQRPAELHQAPLLRRWRAGQSHRPAWFRQDGRLTPALALRLQAEVRGQTVDALKIQPPMVLLGEHRWQLEPGGGYWPSLHPDNLPRVSLQAVLNGEHSIRDKWVLLHVTGTPSSADERLEAQATASLYQKNHSYMPAFIPPLQWLLLGLVLWFLSRQGQKALSPGWGLSLAALMLLVLVSAQVMQAWLHWWIQPAWPTLALGLLYGMHWLRYGDRSPLPDRALRNTRLKLAESWLELERLSDAWSLLRKLPHNPTRFRLLERLHQACVRQGNTRLAAQVLQALRRARPNYRPDQANLPAAMERTEVLAGTDILPATASTDDLSRYRILAELGRGAMAVVHRAVDEKLGREVALKVLPLHAGARDAKSAEIYRRFMQEARAAARLRHPNIVTVYDVGEDGKRAWIAMDLVEGEDLGRYCEPDRLLPLGTLLPLMAQVAEALAYAHDKGVVHRDIKPANMLYEPASGQIVVTDFGVASLQDASQTRTGTVLGSPSYMAPEQVNGKAVDGRADLYALGVSLYQLTTGQLPFQGDTLANVMYRITHEKCTPPGRIRRNLPPGLERVILKAMHKQPARRFESGTEMAAALRALLQS